ncbi:serine/threonine protein phosphatase [Ruegeria sp. ANG-R]|uniref:PP2C family protein-serine/threonine phosphatase n=1 Tax=Ruegeria sp. ANG-R TaxID=1577903 RepID=UPI00057C3806|nr:protein phosphatase 2C domain-containing protein [Ruegeria sp. ANG-R]KIC40527.1 serine/threonine protein phosphatase [Ruegeria sp. ANG-R]
MLATPAYDIALILDQGQRDSQEDAIAARVSDTANAGYVVIADGMGGHDAGDVASQVVISAWRDAMDAQLDGADLAESALLDALPVAAMQANAAMARHSQENRVNLGSTLLGILMLDHRVFWISIGDSPLYLFRDGALSQINEDHSMAPMIDAQMAQGLLSAEEAQAHPDRNQLTSVIMGAEIPKVDCPEYPLALIAGDILILGSDGLQYLSNAEIEALLRTHIQSPARDIADALLQALHAKANPDQDNISIAVVKPAQT